MSRRVLYVFLVIFVLIPQVYKLVMPFEHLFGLNFMPDDAFYYYKTAINIRNGIGSSFDTINYTNGYHPLWMMVCILTAYVTTDLHYYLRFILVINFTFVMLASKQLYDLTRPFLGPLFAFFLIFIFNCNHTSSQAVFNGVETPMYLCLMFTIINRAAFTNFINRTAIFKLSILSALAFLARTDFVIVFPVISLFMIIKFRRAHSISILSFFSHFCLPFVILTIPYLFYNYFMTGYIVQISGLVKATWDTGNNNFAGLASNAKMIIFHILSSISLRPVMANVFLLIVGAFCLYVFFRKFDSKALSSNHVIIIMGTSSIAIFTYYLIYDGKNLRPWHISIVFPTIQLILSFFLKSAFDYDFGKFFTKIFRVLFVVVIAFQYIQIPYYENKIFKVNNGSIDKFHAHEVATWIRNNLPENVTIGCWNAGYLGYFSERKVINLDGLINGPELYHYLKDGRGVYCYILDKKIDYISDYFYGSHDPLEVLNKKLENRLKPVYSAGRTPCLYFYTPSFIDWYVWKVDYSK